MQAVILVGHGSLRSASGAAMIRLAARAQEAGIAPIVRAGFLNYSQPTFADVLERCVTAGATEVGVQPYFLIPGKFVREDIPQLVTTGQIAHPSVTLRLAEPFGDHPSLAELVLKRALAHTNAYHDVTKTALLLMAHGSPDPRANDPIHTIAEQLKNTTHFADVTVCYLGLNDPLIGIAIDTLVAQGFDNIIAVPYFLHVGGHVAEDLPTIIDAACAQHPQITITRAEHLGYDHLLLTVIADRAQMAMQHTM
ncbi:MAG: sirohydrochlorin chelatase [Chloroflexota bacterium]